MNVYDFDGTIYDGDSTLDFYLFLIKKRKKLLLKVPKQVVSIIKYCFKFIEKEELKENFYSAFELFDNLDEFINQFWDKNEHKIKEWYLNQQEPSDVIISASSFILLEPICNRLGIKYLIASNVDKKTGKYKGKNCYGEEKVKRFYKEFKNKTINNFYTDSLSDKPLIDIAKNSFIVKKNKIINYNDYKENKLER